ncbi:hypothetical protein RUM44_011516 [Polyplax serrata]|uniref:Uncharacterized protein n=1 Tax=Polyplax serrata TaxID=468196 RepID=A0ABR1AQ96_POLSC
MSEHCSTKKPYKPDSAEFPTSAVTFLGVIGSKYGSYFESGGVDVPGRAFGSLPPCTPLLT